MNDILVTSEGFKQFNEELERLKKLSQLSAKVGSEAYNDAIGDGWHDNFAFEDSMRESRTISVRIDNMLKSKKLLKIIKIDKKDDNLINVGDMLKIKVKYAPNDIEVNKIKLTGNYLPNIDDSQEILEITLNSPLGRALYLKNIKERKINYEVNNIIIEVEIIEKINN